MQRALGQRLFFVFHASAKISKVPEASSNGNPALGVEIQRLLNLENRLLKIPYVDILHFNSL